MEKVNENQLAWTPIQSRGFGHGAWMKTEAWWTPTTKTVEKRIPTAYSLRRQNGRDKNSWETECYDDRRMKSNDMEYDHRKKFMIEKTGVIGGLNLPEKAQHSREREWEGFSRSYHFSDSKQEVKVIWQKAPHGGPIPRLGVTPGGRKLYHWIPGVGFPISVP